MPKLPPIKVPWIKLDGQSLPGCGCACEGAEVGADLTAREEVPRADTDSVDGGRGI